MTDDERLTWLRVPSEDELPPEVLELWQPSLEKLGFVPNVLRLYALRPDHLVAWNAWYDEAMKGESGLTKAEREMIAVVVSVANDCAYCMAAHGAALRKLTKDPALADAVAADHTSAPVEPRVRAMLDYAVKLDAPADRDERGRRGRAPRRGMERRGRHGRRRGDRPLQHVEPHGLRARLGARTPSTRRLAADRHGRFPPREAAATLASG